MAKVFGFTEFDAKTLKRVAKDRALQPKDSNDIDRLPAIRLTQRTYIVALVDHCPGATYSSGVWTLGTIGAKILHRHTTDTEKLSQDLDNTITTKDLIHFTNKSGDTNVDVQVRVFNLSLLPVIKDAPTIVTQDVFGDLYITGQQQTLIVQPVNDINKGATNNCTVFVDGSPTSLVLSCQAIFAKVFQNKNCVAWASPSNKLLYVGTGECP